MTPDQITAIAAGLTKAQREALLSGVAVGGGMWSLRNAMARKGLFTNMPFRRTAVGEAVRQHIIEQEQQP